MPRRAPPWSPVPAIGDSDTQISLIVTIYSMHIEGAAAVRVGMVHDIVHGFMGSQDDLMREGGANAQTPRPDGQGVPDPGKPACGCRDIIAGKSDFPLSAGPLSASS
jgi:hypothetical protein